MGTTPHVAIVGAGFGGLGVAEQLDHIPVEVTLIDQHNYHTFQPLLYQVATSLLNAEDVGAPALIDDGALNFVIVGAGPTGVETAGALSDLFYNLLPRDYHQLATEKARIIMVEMGKEVLAPFTDNLRAYAKEELERRRVEVRLGEAVAEVGSTFVRLKSGEEIKAHTLIWAAGVRANPLADMLGLPQGRGGRIKLNPDLSVPDHPEIFVVGDMGEVTSDGKVLPQLGSVAMQSGGHVGRQIAPPLHGDPGQPFT